MMTDPAAFIESFLFDPETCQPFRLTEAERVFLKHAFKLTSEGRLKYPELVFSAPKKSGKTAFAAMILIYMVRVIGGRYAEGLVVANSLDQASGRVFAAAARIVEASPLLAQDAKITAEKIQFYSTGAVIIAIPSDATTAAGANPTISCFDELWGFTTERDHRLWDELTVPPTRRIACRLVSTYAGFEGESELLEAIYKRGMAGEEIAPDLYAAGGLLMYWSHHFSASWQTEAWREQQREALRPNAYLRLIENRWVLVSIERRRRDAEVTPMSGLASLALGGLDVVPTETRRLVLGSDHNGGEAVEKRVCRGRPADLNSPGCGRVSTLIRALRPGLLAAAVRHR